MAYKIVSRPCTSEVVLQARRRLAESHRERQFGARRLCLAFTAATRCTERASARLARLSCTSGRGWARTRRSGPPVDWRRTALSASKGPRQPRGLEERAGRQAYYGSGRASPTRGTGLDDIVVLSLCRWPCPVALTAIAVGRLRLGRSLTDIPERQRLAGGGLATKVVVSALRQPSHLLPHWCPGAVLAAVVSLPARRAHWAPFCCEPIGRGFLPPGLEVAELQGRCAGRIARAGFTRFTH